MKVLLFSHIFPSSRHPIRGPYTASVAGVIARSHEVRVVGPTPFWTRTRRPAELLSIPRETTAGLDATFPTYWSVPRCAWMHGRASYRSLRPEVRRLYREFPFDAIFAAWAYPDAVAAARFARDYNSPLVVKVLGSDVNVGSNDPRICEQIREALCRASNVIAVSSALRDRLVSIGVPANRVIVVRNGVDGNRFTIRDRAEARARLGLPDDMPTICYVGNLEAIKGVDVLVEAMGRLSVHGNPGARLVMVGGGSLEGALRRRVAALGLQMRVTFAGKQPHDKIPDWIAAGDALCLPSRNEGCPNVILEALASGRPVVATHVGGIPELIGCDTGVLVPSEDPDRLAAGLVEVMRRRWNAVELRRSVEHLSWDEVGARYQRILEDAVAKWRADSPILARRPSAFQV